VVGPSRLFGDGLPFVIVAPLTTTRRALSFHVEIEPDSATGLSHLSYVQCEMIRSINKKRLQLKLGTITMIDAQKVATIVKHILDY
jgi:mRNA-degrading endonuclease toxin of MazEF toxin-antitoxin module